MSNNLKPCLFCGNDKPKTNTLSVNGECCIRCDICGIEQLYYSNSDEAIEAWNTRADKPQKAEWIAEYERQGNYSHCSLCGCRCAGYAPNYKFCPNCGADMRKDEST